MPYFQGKFVTARRDKNHQDIVDELRYNGYGVIETHCIGNGFPDIIVFLLNYHLTPFLPVEIKSINKQGKQAPLTKTEKLFHLAWQGPPILIATNAQDIITHLEYMIK